MTVPNRMSVSSSFSPCPARTLTQPVLELRQTLARRARKCGLVIPAKKPDARPNTEVMFELYDAKSFPAASSPLAVNVWNELLDGYSGALPQHLEGMILYGAKIGYDPEGPLRTSSRRTTMNLPMDEEAVTHVGREIERRMREGGVRRASEDEHLVASPIGAVPKHSVSGERNFRPIHHLSYPKRRARDQSVNDGINATSVSFRFYQMDKMLREIGAATRRDPANLERRALWKVDLKDAYRHVVVEQSDARLLGFFWPGLGFLYETQLSFGGRSAPFIFNLVAEGFEWILQSLGVDCHHYLDDSFGWVDSSRDIPGVVRLIGELPGR